MIAKRTAIENVTEIVGNRFTTTSDKCSYNGGKIPSRDGGYFEPITTRSCSYIIRQVCTRGNFIHLGDHLQDIGTKWRFH